MKKVISTDAAPAAVGPYSQAVRGGEFLFVSGQIGMDPATGKLVEGGIEKQAEMAIGNLKAIIEAAGGSLTSVVKTTVLLQSISDWAAVNEVYKRHFSVDPPARAAFEAGKLPLGALVEIEAVVYVG